MKRPFVLMKRGKYWYYRLADQKTYHSTGKIHRNHAETWVVNKHNLILEPKLAESTSERPSRAEIALREYIDQFFLWDRCPHVTRLREEGKAISEGYVTKQRRRMETYLCSDEIVDLKIGSIRRSDILDFRRRLIEKNTGVRTINMVIGILKIVLHEALFREDIERDPTLGIGQLKYEQQEIGVFTRQDMMELFAKRPGVWQNFQVYTAFLLAAHCGLRRSETLALTWRQLDLETGRHTR
jgi:integrase